MERTRRGEQKIVSRVLRSRMHYRKRGVRPVCKNMRVDEQRRDPHAQTIKKQLDIVECVVRRDVGVDKVVVEAVEAGVEGAEVHQTVS